MMIHFIEGGGFSGNIYLIEGDHPVIIDTGWDANIDRIAPQIEQALGGKELDKIILTHRHVDHIGGALAIKKKFGGTIYAQKEEAEALRQGDPESTGARMFGTRVKPMDVVDLDDGDVIDLGDGGSLKVMKTPGHTTGGICLLDSEGGLFSGDTVFTEGGVGRWDLPTGDFKMLLKSIEALAELPIVSLYPGHGMPAEKNGAEHIKLSLKNLKGYGAYG